MRDTDSGRSELSNVAEAYLADGTARAWKALVAAAEVAPAGLLVPFAAALFERPEGQEDGLQGGTFGPRCGDVLAVVARVLARAPTPAGDRLLIRLVETERIDVQLRVCEAVLGIPQAEAPAKAPLPPTAAEAVLQQLATHLVPRDGLAAAATAAAALLGERDAVERFAALDDGSPAFGSLLRTLLAYAHDERAVGLRSLALADLVIRRWATHATSFGCTLAQHATQGLLLHVLAKAPDERLDGEILKGLRASLDAEGSDRLGVWLAAAPARALTPKLRKLASERAGAASIVAAPRLVSRGVVATDGGPVLLGTRASLEAWRGFSHDEASRGDWIAACKASGAVAMLDRPDGAVFVLSSHVPVVEAFEAGRGTLLLLLWGDPEDLAEAVAGLVWQETGLVLPAGSPVLLDAAWTMAAAAVDTDRMLPFPARRKGLPLVLATTDRLGVVRLGG